MVITHKLSLVAQSKSSWCLLPRYVLLRLYLVVQLVLYVKTRTIQICIKIVFLSLILLLDGMLVSQGSQHVIDLPILVLGGLIHLELIHVPRPLLLQTQLYL